MTITYIMNAEENYDPTHVTYIGTSPSPSTTQIAVDQSYPGVQYDAVRRNLMYMYTEHISTTTDSNNTAHYIWNGQNAIAPTVHLDQTSEFNSTIAVKSVDTETVAFHLNYNVANVVPSGIGGSDGTYRRFTTDFSTAFAPSGTGGNGPGMTDPYTGNFWINAASCELYCFRLEDNYSQTLSPVFPVENANNQVLPLGFTNNGATNPWTFGQEIEGSGPEGVQLYLIPRLYTSAEITADYLLIYATYSYPIDQTSGDFPIGDHLNTYFCYKAYYREVFDNAGNMYLFGYSPTGGKLFRLWRFNPPTSAPYGGPTVGGGFTEITPWSSSTGPNGDGTAYTLQRTPVFSYGTFTTGGIIPLYQPIANCLVLIEKFFPEEHTVSSTDFSLMFWSCTYVDTIQGSPSYTHFPQFITGYMSADWGSTTLGDAAYAVYDAMEINSYLGQSDYLYSMDYTKVWFLFMCNRVSGGSLVSNGFCSVLVEYSFINGQAPVVTQVVDESGWDAAYPTYKALCKYGTISSSVEQGLSAGIQPTCSWDKGIYDPVTNTFWFSGNGLFPATGTNPPFLQFSSTFSSRLVATSPLMRLSFSSSSTPVTVGQVISFGSEGGPCALIEVTGYNVGTGVYTGIVLGDLGNEIPNDPNNATFPIPAGSWSVTSPVTSIGGLNHLVGKIVWAVADGLVQGPFTVSAEGSITLPIPASNVIVGLLYQQQLQTLKLDTGDPTIQGKRKTIPAVTIRVNCTSGISVGPDLETLTPWEYFNQNLFSYQQITGTFGDDLPYQAPGQLVSNDLRFDVTSDWTVNGEIAVEQNLPLPVTVLAIIPEVVLGDTGK